jgi:SAM-dependent methyltransferase
MQMDARRIPFDEEFDMAGAFDVIEHIEEDTIVLSELHRALKPKGGLLLTVPQHPWLWSQTDEFAHHKRRYMASELHRKVEAAGFSILRSTSFVSILLPALAVSRILPHLRPNFDPLRELNISRISNVILGEMLSVERWILRQGISLPVGGSRLLVAQKK